MTIFHDFDVYDCRYTYDEAKVMCVLGSTPEAEDLDYEDLIRIADAVHWIWRDGIGKKHETHLWMDIESKEEEGYIQAYSQRVLPEFIKLYKEEYKK